MEKNLKDERVVVIKLDSGNKKRETGICQGFSMMWMKGGFLTEEKAGIGREM